MPPLTRPATAGLTRRGALRALAASVALTATGCSRPDEEIVPAVRPSGGAPPGEPQRFATCLPLAGYGRGVHAVSVDGRPVKIEGNARHPASRGATDVFAEADVLSLYDPDRSRTCRRGSEIATHGQVMEAWLDWRARMNRGKSLRILTGRITSPTRLRLIGRLLEAVPGSSWHAYEPTDGPWREGANLAYGRDLDTVPHLDRADVVLCLDADPLGPGPDQIRLSQAWAARRTGPSPSRVFVIEATSTLTGAKADQRMGAHPQVLHDVVLAVARSFGADVPEPVLPPRPERFVSAAIAALKGARGRAVVLTGRTLSPQAVGLVHWINQQLDAPVDLVEPADRGEGVQPADVAALREDLEAGRVGALVTMGANPAYDCPWLDLARHARDIALSIHHATAVDETASLCGWHVPAHHPLEAWSDLRCVDGTVAIGQPLVRPLYDTLSTDVLLARLAGQGDATDLALVRQTWLPLWGADAEGSWRRALEEGVVAATAFTPVRGLAASVPPKTSLTGPAPGMVLLLQPHHATLDGSRANNAWLQECPAPFGKQVWGNALRLSPRDASREGFSDGDVVTITARGARVEAPVQLLPGLPEGVMSLTIGQGRRAAGAIGTGVGTNAYPLQPAPRTWTVPDVRVEKTGRRQDLYTTQHDVTLEGKREDLYPLLRPGQAVPRQEEAVAPPSFYPDIVNGGPSWAMVIDTALCVGCNACVIACQAENNVPVVGPEEIGRGRVMHWLRVDLYDHGTPEEPRPGFQPVPCMQCEKAPCEPVCPVAASVHDGEGLNVQVYNRCVGTRFCEANCPYKVRRFNFFGYADGQEYANLGAEPIQAQRNPEVTVRARGVMEKCTYCIQRIARARQTAETTGREGWESTVTTACQDACPTRAIAFGDLNAANAAPAALRADPRHYALLGHLGTRPRTTYLADVKNGDPALEEGS